MLKKIIDGFIASRKSSTIYLLAIVTGVLCGIISVAFVSILNYTEHFYTDLLLQNSAVNTSFIERVKQLNFGNILLILGVPSLGGLLTGFITTYLAPDAAGTGANEMINAFHNKGGNIDTRVPFVKSLSTIVTLSSGGSGGKEGPISQIGAGVGVLIANFMQLGERARRTLLLAGTAAGLGAVFRAPLGGALTAAEMVYREDIESDALIPCFISSVTAFLIFGLFNVQNELFKITGISKLNFYELPYYLLLGVLCFGFGYLFLKGFKDTRIFIRNTKLVSVLKPALGGLLVGIVYLFFFEVAGTGQFVLQQIFNGLQPAHLGATGLQVALCFLGLAFLKVVATTLTIGTGGSAGMFGPSMFVGATLGASVYYFALFVQPSNEFHLASFMVVGMGAFYAGIASAPMAGIIMICEVTGTYVLLPPLILVSIFTFILSKQINLYQAQVHTRFQSPAHLWDMKIDVLNTTVIADLFTEYRTLAVINNTISYDALRSLSTEIHASDFIVIDDSKRYLGEISLRKHTMEQVEDDAELNFVNILEREISTASPSQSLRQVLDTIMKHDVDKVAIVDKGLCLGYLRTRDVFDAYLKIVKK
jgi:chloride channel protein, CIC family